MTLEQFWSFIEKIHHDAKGDMDVKCELLDAALRRLPVNEVDDFMEHYDATDTRAYHWPLWGAAFVIGGGCSDDAFWDFRATLISMGREVFEKALADPESLAEFNYPFEDAFYEGFQYVGSKVQRDMHQGDPPDRAGAGEPTGEPFDEDTVAELFPKLTKKYDF